ncbi:MAG: hypothetical protein IKO19_14075 [Candidatus Riflebacteria bacterium]|nr:hypothetical protein [Candidatus Riflebacteria bacterium]MBR4571782.1 hypothetical protein [Candidatus Riflebacteria bacterium]
MFSIVLLNNDTETNDTAKYIKKLFIVLSSVCFSFFTKKTRVITEIIIKPQETIGGNNSNSPGLQILSKLLGNARIKDNNLKKNNISVKPKTLFIVTI